MITERHEDGGTIMLMLLNCDDGVHEDEDDDDARCRILLIAPRHSAAAVVSELIMVAVRLLTMADEREDNEDMVCGCMDVGACGSELTLALTVGFFTVFVCIQSNKHILLSFSFCGQSKRFCC